jgi:hypothetical protein
MVLNLRRFNMSSIEFNKNETKGPVIVLLGRRDTGKSVLVKDLLFYHQDIPIGTVMSGTEDGNGFFSDLVPKLFVHNEYNTAIVERALLRQKHVMMEHMKACKLASARNQPIPPSDPRTFVIMDDCLFDDKWTRDKVMRCLFMNGRHWKIMLIITMQYPLGVPPAMRSNVDYVFILRNPIKSDRKRIYENYAGMFDTFEAFCQVMDQCTEDYRCLVIHQNARSNKLSDQVFWYRADIHGPFRLGAKYYWDLSKTLGEDSSSYNNPEYDGSKMQKASHVSIAVKRKN